MKLHGFVYPPSQDFDEHIDIEHWMQRTFTPLHEIVGCCKSLWRVGAPLQVGLEGWQRRCIIWT